MEFIESWNTVLVKLIEEPMIWLPSLLSSGQAAPNLDSLSFSGGLGILHINGRAVAFNNINAVVYNLKTAPNGKDSVIGIHVQDSVKLVSIALAAILGGRPFLVIEYNTTMECADQVISATKLTVLVTDSTSFLNRLRNGTIKVIDADSLLASSSKHSNGIIANPSLASRQLQYVYEIEEDGNLVARWITLKDVESSSDITSQYVTGNLQVLAPCNSVLFSLALMLHITHGSVHIYTAIDHLHLATTKTGSLLMPSDSLLYALDEVKRLKPQLLWLHGPPPGLAFLLHLFPDDIVIISQSLVPSQYLVTHYFELSKVKEAILNRSSYTPLGLVSSAISWKLVGADNRILQRSGSVGLFVVTCKEFDIVSKKAVRQSPDGHFVAVAQSLTALGQDHSILSTAVDKHPRVMWASVTESSIIYASTSPVDLQEYIATTVPAIQTPSILKRIDRPPLTVSLALNAKKLKLIATKDATARHCSLDIKCFITSTATDLLKKILGFEDIDYKRRFQSLGGHSLQAMQLAAQLSDRLNLKSFSVTIQSIFEAHSIGHLIQRLHKLAASEGHVLTCMCLCLQK